MYLWSYKPNKFFKNCAVKKTHDNGEQIGQRNLFLYAMNTFFT